MAFCSPYNAIAMEFSYTDYIYIYIYIYILSFRIHFAPFFFFVFVVISYDIGFTNALFLKIYI